jgi:hypothetical protein
MRAPWPEGNEPPALEALSTASAAYLQRQSLAATAARAAAAAARHANGTDPAGSTSEDSATSPVAEPASPLAAPSPPLGLPEGQAFVVFDLTQKPAVVKQLNDAFCNLLGYQAVRAALPCGGAHV